MKTKLLSFITALLLSVIVSATLSSCAVKKQLSAMRTVDSTEIVQSGSELSLNRVEQRSGITAAAQRSWGDMTGRVVIEKYDTALPKDSATGEHPVAERATIDFKRNEQTADTTTAAAAGLTETHLAATDTTNKATNLKADSAVEIISESKPTFSVWSWLLWLGIAIGVAIVTAISFGKKWLKKKLKRE